MDKHTRTGTVLAALTSFAALALAAMAFLPVEAAPLPLTEENAPIDHSTEAHMFVPAPTPIELAPVEIKADRKSDAPKAKRRICDRRGSTMQVGYAIPTETRIAGETMATVCWTE